MLYFNEEEMERISKIQAHMDDIRLKGVDCKQFQFRFIPEKLHVIWKALAATNAVSMEAFGLYAVEQLIYAMRKRAAEAAASEEKEKK